MEFDSGELDWKDSMIEHILTLGLTGPERAALDIAGEFEIDVQDGETRLELAAEGDGTLILSEGALTDADEAIREAAETHGRPCLHIDLMSIAAFGAARRIAAWLRDHNIGILHITGSDGGPELPTAAADVLATALRLEHVDAAMPGALSLFRGDRQSAEMPVTIPRSVHQAVEILRKKLNFKERTRIANMSDHQLLAFTASMERYFMNEFRLWTGNEELAASCRRVDEEKGPSVVILEALREKLRSTNILRVVK